MASSPRLRSLSLETMPDLPEGTEPLVEQLNGFLTDAGNAFDSLIREQDPGFVLKKVSFTAPEPVWISVTPTGSWVYYGAPWPSIKYRIDENGCVHFRGHFKNGVSGSTAFTFPIGYRPAENEQWGTTSGAPDGPAFITVDTSGNVTLAGPNTYFPIGERSFLATTPAAPTAPATNGWPLSVSHGYTNVDGLECIKAVCPDNPGDLVGAPRFDWAPSSRSKLLLKNVYGCIPGRNYEVTLKIYGS